MARELERQVNVKFDHRTYTRIEEVSERLDLRISDVVRRAVTEGLKAFDRARLPGSPAGRTGQLSFDFQGGHDDD
jgi:hypothetical protein